MSPFNLISRFIVIIGLAVVVSIPSYADHQLDEVEPDDAIVYDFITTQLIDSLLKQGEEFLNDDQKIPLALKELRDAYEYSRRIHYSYGVLKSCKQLGNYFLSKSDNANATMYYYLYRKQAENTADTASIIDAQVRLGLVMYNMNKWEDAYAYFNKAKQIAGGNPSYQHNINLVKYLMGVSLVKLGIYGRAREYLYEIDTIALKAGDSMRSYECRMYLNKIEGIVNANDAVQTEYDQIADYFLRNNQLMGYSFAIEGKAKAYLNQGKLDSAYNNAQKALKIARDLNLIFPISEILSTLVEIEKANGDLEAAFKHLDELSMIKDSTNNLEVAAQIAMLGASYEFEIKETMLDQKIAEKERQNLLFGVLFIATLLVVIAVLASLRLVRKQQKKLNALLHNILPDHTVKELQETGHSIPKGHKDITIVFADVKSFTQIASHLKPHVLVEMLDRYFVQFDAIITKYDLEKIKTIGDAYMFVAGLEEDEERKTQRAALACLDMIAAIKEMKDSIEEKFGQSFEFRFGMHTGNVVSGVVGDKKYAFDIWGDAVNIAARMEETSEPGKINISHHSMDIIKDEFNCTYRGSFEIKNRGIVEMYYLEGETEVSP